MRCEDLKAGLEARFRHATGKPSTLSQTGEPYVEIVVGVQPTRQGPAVLCLTDEAAVQVLSEAINEYAKGRKGTLYWRVVPEVARRDLYRRVDVILGLDTPTYEPVELWAGYARLLISDKPELSQ